jgi:hypothetical protein
MSNEPLHIEVSSADDANYQVFGLLREVRADVQHLLTAVAALQQATQQTDETQRAAAVSRALADATETMGRSERLIGQRLRAIRTLEDNWPTVRDSFGDGIVQIENSWTDTVRSWPKADAAAGSLPPLLTAAEQQLSAIVYSCGILTIPNRVNQHLASVGVGHALDFNANFSDELTDPAQRRQVLEYLHNHPNAIDGVVDVDAGLLYRVISSGIMRWRAMILTTSLAVLGGVAAYISAHFFDTPVDHSQWKAFVGSYVAVIAGGLAHVLVGVIKEVRGAKPTAFVAVNDGIGWIQIHESQILAALAFLWIGVIGYAVTSKHLNVTTAFFVGYSIDSVGDIYLQKFTTTAKQQTAAIEKTLAI